MKIILDAMGGDNAPEAPVLALLMRQNLWEQRLPWWAGERKFWRS